MELPRGWKQKSNERSCARNSVTRCRAICLALPCQPRRFRNYCAKGTTYSGIANPTRQAALRWNNLDSPCLTRVAPSLSPSTVANLSEKAAANRTGYFWRSQLSNRISSTPYKGCKNHVVSANGFRPSCTAETPLFMGSESDTFSSRGFIG